MNNNAACHLYATVLNCTVTCNLQPIVGHFVTMTEKRLSGVWNPLITSVSHRSCQPLQIITGIKSPLSSSHPSPFPQRRLFSAKRPSLSLTILLLSRLCPSLVLCLPQVAVGWFMLGRLFGTNLSPPGLFFFHCSVYLSLLLPLSWPPISLALVVLWASFGAT